MNAQELTKQFEDKLAQAVKKYLDRKCVWTYNEAFDYYDTACGEGFYLDHEWSDKFKFCTYCGGQIQIQDHEKTKTH